MAASEMHAWQAIGGRLVWSRMPVPTPGPDETLLRVRLTGVCGSDVAKLTKAVIPDPGRPWLPGHEIVGTDPSGSSVAVSPLISCGECPRCSAGEINVCPSLQMIGWHRPGGFAEYVTVPRDNIVRVPNGLPEARAVLAEPMAVAVHGVRCALSCSPPGALAVIGGGALGIASAAYAAGLGWQVAVLVRDPARLASVLDVLDVVVLPLASRPTRQFDAVIDAAGGVDDSPFDAAVGLVRDGGTIVVQTAYSPGVKLSRDLRDLIRRGLTVRGSFAFCRGGGRSDFTAGMDFITADGGWADPLVGQRFALRSLPEALEAVRRRDERGVIKAVLVS